MLTCPIVSRTVSVTVQSLTISDLDSDYSPSQMSWIAKTMEILFEMFLIKSGHLVINRIKENQIPFNLSVLETAVCCAEDDPYLLS